MARVGAQNIDPVTTGNTDYGPLDIASAIAPTLDLSLTVCQQFTVDLYANAPSSHDIQLDSYGVASTKAFMPTVTFLFHPLPDSEWDPYVGLGANYTMFSDTTHSVSYATVDLHDTLGAAFQFGLDYHIAKHIVVGSGIRYSPLSPKVDVNGTEYNSLHIDLLTYGLTLGVQL